MRLPTFLALKYLKPKRSVASVITCVSILGVLLGVAVVIIVRSVMTGFGDVWREKILGFQPHVAVVSSAGYAMTGENRLVERLKAIEGVSGVTSQVQTRAMLSHDDAVYAPCLIGLGGTDFTEAYKVGRPVQGTFDLVPGGVIVGAELARMLNLRVGSPVTVCAPPKPDEVFLPRKWKVTGIFSSGHHDYDTDFVIADLDSVRDLMGLEEGVSSICLKTDCPTEEARFNRIVSEIDRAVNPPPLPGGRRRYRVQSWKEMHRQIFNALAVETNMTAVLLLLISLVALFCVMNTLLVLTVQKTPEIGLLKALGFGKLSIMGVFLVHGLIQCTIGVGLGLLASWAVLSNLQRIVSWLATCGMEVFPAEIYKLDEIPHHIIASDVVYVVVIIYIFGLLASLVPALIAASKDPVKALNEG